MTQSLQPRIYVACLAAYNSGHLHGAWIDAAQSSDEIREEIQSMLASSPILQAEEWGIHDFEGFAGIHLSEFAGLEEVSRVAALLVEHGAAFGAFASNFGLEHATGEGFEEAYCGEWESETAYAEHLFDELYLHDVPETVQPYIDYEKFARDLFMCDYYSAQAPQGVFVFRHT
ncbi:MAG: antirestriction protein ArdA [Pirellulales bacterium]|nr:antirestriction protein ArdA [Pirellulales bacterium]